MKKYVVILVAFVCASIFLAALIDTLTFENDDFNERTKNEDFLQMTDTKDNLIWFVQISDIHLSIFQYPERITDFREFCDYTINAINPEVVLASGDLTHAAGSTIWAESGQYRQEWEHYRNILNSTNILNKTKWLDIRGNHDMFNVMNFQSEQNLFRKYSVQGKTHPRSYAYDLKKGSNVYKFIALDAGSSPGLRRNFNFMGTLKSDDLAQVHQLVKFGNDSKEVRKHTIWFGHFPTSCILTIGENGENIREIIGASRSSLTYLCGHLHTIFGWVPQMYTMQKNGYLELEVGDWKDNRMFRVLAIDHGLLSFVDLVHRDWPVVLITNPKDSKFLNPSRENINNIRNSTHLRILAFSLSSIKSVKVKIDGNSWIDCVKIDEGPLYVSKWNPDKYSKGSHSIRVKVEDFDGRIKEIVQSFSLFYPNHEFGLKARFALMIDGPKVFFYMLVFLVLITSVPLMILRRIDYKVDRDSWNLLDLWLKKFWVLSKIDRFFYPMVIYPIYTLLGPWCVGFLIEDYFGVLFSWGLYINSKFMPGAFTYYSAHLHLVKFHLPFLVILAYVVEYKNNREKSGLLSFVGYLICNMVFVYLMYKRLLLSLSFYHGYGLIVSVSGPLWTWSIILIVYLWIHANFTSVLHNKSIRIKAKL